MSEQQHRVGDVVRLVDSPTALEDFGISAEEAGKVGKVVSVDSDGDLRVETECTRSWQYAWYVPKELVAGLASRGYDMHLFTEVVIKLEGVPGSDQLAAIEWAEGHVDCANLLSQTFDNDRTDHVRRVRWNEDYTGFQVIGFDNKGREQCRSYYDANHVRMPICPLQHYVDLVREVVEAFEWDSDEPVTISGSELVEFMCEWAERARLLVELPKGKVASDAA